MKCAWNKLLSILPISIRSDVDKYGAETMQELRLRLDKPAELVLPDHPYWLKHCLTKEEIRFVINAASHYSPWSATTISQGYITADGGHRIGICGDVAIVDGKITGMHDITSLCIRVARDIPMVSDGLSVSGNILIIGPPGSGKTTFLRDLCRRIADHEPIAVVDERGEIFPKGFEWGRRIDVLHGCAKASGIEMVLRTMSPTVIAVDEITAREDVLAMERASWCGVRLIATAHAADREDLHRRKVYESIVTSGLFDTFVVLSKDLTWRQERTVAG